MKRRVTATSLALAVLLVASGPASLAGKVGPEEMGWRDAGAGVGSIGISGSASLGFRHLEIWGSDETAYVDPFADPEFREIYQATSELSNELELNLEATPAEGVEVSAALRGAITVAGGELVPSDQGLLSISSLDLSVTTPGFVRRLHAGKVDPGFEFLGLSKEVFGEYGFDGASAELTFGGVSATGFFTKDVQWFNGPLDAQIDLSDTAYIYGGQLWAEPVPGLKLRAAAVQVARAFVPAGARLRSLAEGFGGEWALASGWTLRGEVARSFRNYTWSGTVAVPSEEESGRAASVSLAGGLGPVQLLGYYTLVEPDFRPEFAALDDGTGEGAGLKIDSRTAGLNVSWLLGQVTLSAGYSLAGDAGWSREKTAVTTVGAAYSGMAGDVKLDSGLYAAFYRPLIGSEDGRTSYTRVISAGYGDVSASYRAVDFPGESAERTLEFSAKQRLAPWLTVDGSYALNASRTEPSEAPAKESEGSTTAVGLTAALSSTTTVSARHSWTSAYGPEAKDLMGGAQLGGEIRSVVGGGVAVSLYGRRTQRAAASGVSGTSYSYGAGLHYEMAPGAAIEAEAGRFGFYPAEGVQTSEPPGGVGPYSGLAANLALRISF